MGAFGDSHENGNGQGVFNVCAKELVRCKNVDKAQKIAHVYLRVLRIDDTSKSDERIKVRILHHYFLALRMSLGKKLINRFKANI